MLTPANPFLGDQPAVLGIVPKPSDVVDSEAAVDELQAADVPPEMIRTAEALALWLRRAWLADVRAAWVRRVKALQDEADAFDRAIAKMQEESRRRREALMEIEGRSCAATAEWAQARVRLRELTSSPDPGAPSPDLAPIPSPHPSPEHSPAETNWQEITA